MTPPGDLSRRNPLERFAALFPLAVASLLPAARPVCAAESALIVVDPTSSVAARVIVEDDRSARCVFTVRGGPGAPAARLGVDLPHLVVGPVTLAGVFAELASPASAGPTSPRWHAPASVALDASLVPASRAGLFVLPVPTTGVAAWLFDDTLTAAAAVRARAGVAFVDAAAAASRPLAIEAPGLAGLARRAADQPEREDPLDSSWFGGPPRPRRVLHTIVRVGAAARRVAGSAAVIASLPTATLPGVGVRVAARSGSGRGLRLSAVARLASPELRELNGDRVQPSAGWQAAAAVGGRLSLSLGAGSAYSSPEKAYAGVALTPERLAPPRTDYTARVSLRPGEWRSAHHGGDARGQPAAELRSVSVGGLVRTEPRAPVLWRADARAALALRAGAVEVEPSIRLDAAEGVRLRLRSVVVRRGCTAPAVRAMSLVGRMAYEVGPPWAQDGDAGPSGDGELTGSVELRLEFVRREAGDETPTDPE